jgi:hypothetical protein
VAHPASYSKEAGAVYPGSKRPGHKADYVSPSNYVPALQLPHMCSCCGASVIKLLDNFTFSPKHCLFHSPLSLFSDDKILLFYVGPTSRPLFKYWLNYVGSEALAADITPCCPFKMSRRFEKTDLCLPPAFTLFLLCPLFDPEDGGDIFHRNLGWPSTVIRHHIQGDTALHWLNSPMAL